MSDSLPILWQLDVSHYSEKARWALAYKGIEHERRSPLPGSHIAAALWMTRGSHATLPILVLDGRRIWDSTAIIAALEAKQPEPALYPADPELRRKALALEDFFDEELGPYIRQLAFFELGNDRDSFRAVVQSSVPAPLAKVPGVATAYARLYTSLRFRAHDRAAAERGRGKVTKALDRLESELDSGGGEYLVGDEFTVADLTAASLFYPLVLPAEGPISPDLPAAAGLESFREDLRDRPGYRWVEEMFRRHRKPGRPATAAATG